MGIASWITRPGLVRTLVTHVRLANRLIREPRVPLLAKALPILSAVYLVAPFDFVPDVIPLLGQIDDMGLIAVVLQAFLRISPPAAVAFHRTAIAERRRYSPMPPSADVIDAEWRRE